MHTNRHHPHSRCQRSLLACALALPVALPVALAAQDQNVVPDDTVILDTVEVVSTRENNSYAVDNAAAATGLDLSPRETPQSISVITRQRIEDQNLQSLTDIANATTGLSTQTYDSERVLYFSRGFEISNYLYDGVPSVANYGSYGDIKQDTAIFERVDVVRGATGLLTGPGNPSASINLVRKHADSKVLTGSVTASVGSWDNYRGVLDVSTPLNADGSVRGRFISVYQDKNSYLDYYELQKKVFYGVIDADLSENTTVSVGYDYQEVTPNGVTWGGLPMLFSDGTPTDWSRSKSTSADWTYWDTTIQTAFVGLKHRFENDWLLNAQYTHREREYDCALLYMFGALDKTTGTGLTAGTGRYVGESTLDGVDLNATGSFELFGREHELVVGFSASKTDNEELGTAYDTTSVTVGNFYNWNGSASTRPAFGPFVTSYDDTTTTQTGTYAAARFSLTDSLRLITGARFSTWENTGGASDYEYEEPTLYGGLIYDINRTYSAYLSYTDIFSPQTAKDATNTLVDPILGTNIEAGLKAQYFNQRLNLSAAVFQTKQDNYYETDYGTVLPDGSNPVYSVGSITSKGVEAEVSGLITPSWNVSLGASYYTIKDANDDNVATSQPRTSVKLFSAYTLDKLAFGGGVTWQSKSYNDSTGLPRLQQDPFFLVDVFARYRFTEALSAQVNISNLLDEKYYVPLGFYGNGLYGEPRNITLTLKYTF